MAKRLTKTIIEGIINNLSSRTKFAKKMCKLRDERLACIEKIRLMQLATDTMTGEEVEKAVLKITADANVLLETIPTGVTNVHNVIPLTHEFRFIYMSGKATCSWGMHLDGYCYDSDLRRCNTPGFAMSDMAINKICPASKPLVESAIPLFKICQANVEKIKSLVQEQVNYLDGLRAQLRQYTTVEKLVAAWPEVKAMLPEDAVPKPKAKLPVIQVSTLNKELDLPD